MGATGAFLRQQSLEPSRGAPSPPHLAQPWSGTGSSSVWTLEREPIPRPYFLPHSSWPLHPGARTHTRGRLPTPPAAQESGSDSGGVSHVDLNDRVFRHGLDIVLVATIANFAGGVGGQLSRCGVHGLATVLRPVVPCHASRVRRLPGVRTLACGLCRLPYRRRGDLIF